MGSQTPLHLSFSASQWYVGRSWSDVQIYVSLQTLVIPLSMIYSTTSRKINVSLSIYFVTFLVTKHVALNIVTYFSFLFFDLLWCDELNCEEMDTIFWCWLLHPSEVARWRHVGTSRTTEDGYIKDVSI